MSCRLRRAKRAVVTLRRSRRFRSRHTIGNMTCSIASGEEGARGPGMQNRWPPGKLSPLPGWRRSLSCSACRHGLILGAVLVPVGPTSGPKWSHRADPRTSPEVLPWPCLGRSEGMSRPATCSLSEGCCRLLSNRSQVRVPARDARAYGQFKAHQRSKLRSGDRLCAKSGPTGAAGL
jgi:hypothetical protein